MGGAEDTECAPSLYTCGHTYTTCMHTHRGPLWLLHSGGTVKPWPHRALDCKPTRHSRVPPAHRTHRTCTSPCHPSAPRPVLSTEPSAHTPVHIAAHPAHSCLPSAATHPLTPGNPWLQSPPSRGWPRRALAAPASSGSRCSQPLRLASGWGAALTWGTGPGSAVGARPGCSHLCRPAWGGCQHGGHSLYPAA